MVLNVAKIMFALCFVLSPASISLAGQTDTRQFKPTKVEESQLDEKPAAIQVKRSSERRQRTREEVQTLIEHAGKTKPEWWDSVPLTYPETLDLNFPARPDGTWKTKKNIGPYMWSIINENSNRFRSGTKLMHYVYSLNKDNPEVTRKTAEQLGHCYFDLLQDWSRAAYWMQKINNRGIDLANAYWQLGSKEMAEEIIRPIKSDNTHYGAVIKLWSDMDQLNTALELANQSKDSHNKGGIYRAAGDALQRHGKFDEALVYYQKVLDTGSRLMPEFLNRNEVQKINKNHAKAAIKNIRIFEMFEVNKLRDGNYTGKTLGYNSEVHVQTTVKNRRIVSVKVVKHSEKQYYASLTDMPEKIIRRQDIRDIDATTGATVTADAIRIATAKALHQARE